VVCVKRLLLAGQLAAGSVLLCADSERLCHESDAAHISGSGSGNEDVICHLAWLAMGACPLPRW